MMTHTCKALDSTTARIVFEYKDSFHTWRKLSINRIYFYRSRGPVISQGAVLGRDEGKPSAMILDVRQRDLVVVRSRDRNGGDFTCQYFRIGDDFEPQNLGLTNSRFWDKEVAGLIELCDLDRDRQVDSCDESLRDFLADPHPAWLHQILARQIHHWRLNKPERFFRLAPSRATNDDVVICIRDFPLLALAHQKPRLSKKQIRSCIRRSLKGGVMYAPEALSAASIAQAVNDHPREMIRFAAGRLSDHELRRCAQREPYTAFECRSLMTPKRRATLLAISYPYRALFHYGKPIADLHSEIINSISHYPEQWLDNYRHDYNAIFRGLRSNLGLVVNAALLQRIMEETPAEYRKPLMEHIAGTI